MEKRRPGYLTSIEAWERAEGAAAPLGAAWIEEHQSDNFALYSRHATGVTLLLYDEHNFFEPIYQRQLDYLTNKTGRVWHCWVSAAEPAGPGGGGLRGADHECVPGRAPLTAR
jgi:isoamylase